MRGVQTVRTYLAYRFVLALCWAGPFFPVHLFLAHCFFEALKPVDDAGYSNWQKGAENAGGYHISSPTLATMSNARVRIGSVSTMDTRWYTLEGLPGAMSAARCTRMTATQTKTMNSAPAATHASKMSSADFSGCQQPPNDYNML
jgi:hypothetical protein